MHQQKPEQVMQQELQYVKSQIKNHFALLFFVDIMKVIFFFVALVVMFKYLQT